MQAISSQPSDRLMLRDAVESISHAHDICSLLARSDLS